MGSNQTWSGDQSPLSIYLEVLRKISSDAKISSGTTSSPNNTIAPEEPPNSSTPTVRNDMLSQHVGALQSLEERNAKDIDLLKNENSNLKEKLDKLHAEAKKYSQFLKIAEKTTNTIRWIAIGTVVATVFLVLFFVYWYCQADKFSPLINFIGLILCCVSFGELIYIPYSIKKIESRIEELEKKVLQK